MRLFQASLLRKASSAGDATHVVERKIVLADSLAQARKRALEDESLPDALVAIQVEDMRDAKVVYATSTREPATLVRDIIDEPGDWEVLSEDLDMPEPSAPRP